MPTFNLHYHYILQNCKNHLIKKPIIINKSAILWMVAIKNYHVFGNYNNGKEYEREKKIIWKLDFHFYLHILFCWAFCCIMCDISQLSPFYNLVNIKYPVPWLCWSNKCLCMDIFILKSFLDNFCVEYWTITMTVAFSDLWGAFKTYGTYFDKLTIRATEIFVYFCWITSFPLKNLCTIPPFECYSRVKMAHDLYSLWFHSKKI